LKTLYLGMGLLWLSLFPVFAQRDFSRGEELFLQNKPQEALVFLEAAAAEEPGNSQAALYLGIAYEQLNRPDEALAVYLHYLSLGTADTARVSFNAGNLYYAQGDDEAAERYYTQAISAAPGLGPAYLNRANTRIRRGKPNEALPDYEQFLRLVPDSPKRSQIEQLTAFIRAEFAAAERRRLLEEARAAEEAERRRQLLEEVSASLQAASEDTQGLSAGTEEMLDYEGEFELE
jgi:tetratricopeptide (TPR) repeat protein